jgi:hypothetical protein
LVRPISEYTDVNDLRVVMTNAKRLQREDIWREAFSRLCSLQASEQEDPLYRDFYATLAAYEELLAEKNGQKRRPATYVRRKIKNKGIIQCLEDWAISSKITDGFKLLASRGLIELTGEYLVTKYPNRFSEKAVAAAHARLATVG